MSLAYRYPISASPDRCDRKFPCSVDQGQTDPTDPRVGRPEGRPPRRAPAPFGEPSQSRSGTSAGSCSRAADPAKKHCQSNITYMRARAPQIHRSTSRAGSQRSDRLRPRVREMRLSEGLVPPVCSDVRPRAVAHVLGRSRRWFFSCCRCLSPAPDLLECAHHILPRRGVQALKLARV